MKGKATHPKSHFGSHFYMRSNFFEIILKGKNRDEFNMRNDTVEATPKTKSHFSSHFLNKKRDILMLRMSRNLL